MAFIGKIPNKMEFRKQGVLPKESTPSSVIPIKKSDNRAIKISLVINVILLGLLIYKIN